MYGDSASMCSLHIGKDRSMGIYISPVVISYRKQNQDPADYLIIFIKILRT
jgi:hypothetical protein